MRYAVELPDGTWRPIDWDEPIRILAYPSDTALEHGRSYRAAKVIAEFSIDSISGQVVRKRSDQLKREAT